MTELPLFYDSQHCRPGTGGCVECRDEGPAGHAARERITALFDFDPVGECPRKTEAFPAGVPWGYKGPMAAPGPSRSCGCNCGPEPKPPAD